jgi:hypothetical protein
VLACAGPVAAYAAHNMLNAVTTHRQTLASLCPFSHRRHRRRCRAHVVRSVRVVERVDSEREYRRVQDTPQTEPRLGTLTSVLRRFRLVTVQAQRTGQPESLQRTLFESSDNDDEQEWRANGDFGGERRSTSLYGRARNIVSTATADHC